MPPAVAHPPISSAASVVGRGSEPEIAPAGDARRRLSELEALTDTALGRLGVEDLLGELLRRTQAILNVDTAAVLLLDDAGQELVATAAAGLEEGVRQRVRVPVGHGFAGRIAASKRPVMLDRIDATTVTNPILWERGIRAMLGVPLLAGGELIGVLHVGRLHHESFTTEDEELLAVVAERLAGATQARRFAVEQAAAELLERSLRPARLPECEGLALAAHYLTPEDRSVGGDWYDVFSGPDGRLWAVVGDVAGHGLPAAVIMGRVRSALRAYTLVEDSAATVLELTDLKVDRFEIGAMVTAICATSLPPYDEWEIATAGHPPPAIVAADSSASVLDLPVGPPLSGMVGVTRSSAVVTVPAGGVLFLYTDGLVERRGEALDRGFERLCAALHSGAPDVVCQDVIRRLLGGRGPSDDVAVLAISRSGS